MRILFEALRAGDQIIARPGRETGRAQALESEGLTGCMTSNESLNFSVPSLFLMSQIQTCQVVEKV